MNIIEAMDAAFQPTPYVPGYWKPGLQTHDDDGTEFVCKLPDGRVMTVIEANAVMSATDTPSSERKT